MLVCADLSKDKISDLIFSAEARVIKSSSTGTKMGDKSSAFRAYPFSLLLRHTINHFVNGNELFGP